MLKMLIAASLSLAAQEKPVALDRGLGTHHHPIATKNPEAQKFFDQGLVLLYGFNRYEAQRSFQKAADLDPQAAMPHWGLAATYAPHINMDLDGDVDLKKACEAAGRAAKLAVQAAEKEYTASAQALCKDHDAYIAALEALHSSHPDDLDAATFFADSLMVPVRWRWWEAGKPMGRMAEAIRIIEHILKRYPNHPGANHFYVHAMEMSPNPEYALPSAQRLMGGIAPHAGHLVHMAGHTYLRVGDYEIVAESNRRAIQVDEEYFHHSGAQSNYVGYYAHNVHFLVYARMMQGRHDEALEAAQKLAAILKPVLEQFGPILDPFVPMAYFVELRFGRWDAILAMPPTPEKFPASKAIRHFARAIAHQAKGQPAQASTEQAAFEAARKAVPADAMWISNKVHTVLEVASHVLNARMSADPRGAVPHWRKAIEVQDKLTYEEPPAWFYPLRESLGAALLRSGDARQAEQVFRDDLERTPRSGRSLFGLMKALEGQGKAIDAGWVKAEFERAWKHAQTSLRIEDY